MDPRKLFADERFAGLCVYCGGDPSTRDHVPSKVLLDEPYPDDLPVVPACETCNSSFSSDEQYVACLLEVIITGTVDTDAIGRQKIRRILMDNPHLASRVAATHLEEKSGTVQWKPELDRVQNVLLKLARGHSAYEWSEPQLAQPQHFSFIPLCVMSKDQLQLFESTPVEYLWPEIGSRSFDSSVLGYPETVTGAGWQIVQEGRYRYMTSHSNGILVRCVLSEYLACEVIW